MEGSGRLVPRGRDVGCMKCFPGDEAEFVGDAVINQQPV